MAALAVPRRYDWSGVLLGAVVTVAAFLLSAVAVLASPSVAVADLRADAGYAYDAGPWRYDPGVKHAVQVGDHDAPSTVLDRPTVGASGRSLALSGGPSAPEATRIFRAVEPDELADLVGSGRYRTVPGLEGKYFFPTQQQAENFAELMAKTGRGPYCITSGCIDSGLLRQLEPLSIAGEGRAWFVPENLLPYIDDIVIHGPAG